MGLKEEILGLEDREVVEVEVAKWGGRKVRVMAMTAAERDEYELVSHEEYIASQTQKRRARNVRARLLVHCLVDDQNQRLFSVEDIEALGKKSAAALDQLYAVAQRLNGYSQKDLEKLEEKTEKN